MAELRLAGKEQRCAAREFALFLRVDGRRRGYAPRHATVADLDDNEAVPVAHDQVDFAEPARIVGNNEDEPLPFQEAQCAPLGAGA